MTLAAFHTEQQPARCVSCIHEDALAGDVYCLPCRQMIDRANPDDQLSWPGLLPAEPAGDVAPVPGQLDLSDALDG
jgi:hypothetical protein